MSPCTCAAIRASFDPAELAEGTHHPDCPCFIAAGPDFFAADGSPRQLVPSAEVFSGLEANRFAPYGDWVVVKLDDLPQMTDGKHGAQLHRPWRVADWTAYGRVIAVGPGPRDPETGARVPIDDIRIGQHVVFEWRPSHEKEAIERLCGERTILLHAHEIVGEVEDGRAFIDFGINPTPEQLRAAGFELDSEAYRAARAAFFSDASGDYSPVTAREASGALDGGGPA